MKLKIHKSKDSTYKFSFLDKILNSNKITAYQIRLNSYILSFVFGMKKQKPDVIASKTLTEAAKNWDAAGFKDIASYLSKIAEDK